MYRQQTKESKLDLDLDLFTERDKKEDNNVVKVGF